MEPTPSRRTMFEELLSSREVLVADGAMGTALFDLGLEAGGCPELLNVERPELIRKVHSGYLEAGADIILTNTFGGNRSRLALHGLGNRVGELNRAAVAIARRAAAIAGRPVVVAGSIGPTGELFEPLGPLTTTAGTEIFAEQVTALVAAGVDVLWIETLSSWEELQAAVDAARGRGVPVVTTLSFDTNGHTMMGIAPAAFGEWGRDAGESPIAIGANCGVGPPDIVQAVVGIASAAPETVVVAKGNCGLPLYKDDALAYPTGPEQMADYTRLAVRAGARIVGACCGSGFDHVAVIRRTVDSGIEGGPPTEAEITAVLGLGSGAVPQRPRRRSSRRRRVS
jgi:methionine synthase I (cobalamin-dependent)